jgi:adenosylhomocysteine nucleosidase
MYAIVKKVVMPPMMSARSSTVPGDALEEVVMVGLRRMLASPAMIRRTLRALLVAVVVTGTAGGQGTPPGGARGPVIVQGAMDVEVRKLAASLESAVEEHVGGWTFWRGTIGGAPVVVSKTLKGMENAAAATALAIERYHPSAIINQGTAGGHDPALHVADIVVGLEAVNIGSFKTGERKRGEGSAFSGWVPLDLNRSEGSAGQDPDARRMRRFPADAALLSAARQARRQYGKAAVVEGVIASSDTWNSELDRIAWLHDTYGTTVEEMETASAAQVAAVYGVPFLGIRVVSNNITTGAAYDRTTGEAGQDFVLLTLRNLAVSGLRPGGRFVARQPRPAAARIPRL